MRLNEFKGEEAFKVMGRVVRSLRGMFKDEKVLAITTKKEEGWMLEFLEYSLSEQANIWLELFCNLNPDIKAEEVTTLDVISFAYEFTQDEQMMSLFFSQSQMKPKTSIGSATENIEV